MKKTIFNKRSALFFKHFNRKGYSLFAALGKEVLIGVLSVSTLSYAKAEGIATKPLAKVDSLSMGEHRLDEVQVMGSRAPLTALQSAKIVEVITRDDINRAEAHTINDILKLVTGVDVRQRSGFGVQTDISINGGTFDQITILLNGMPLSSPQTGHNAADFPVSLSDIDRIEVLQGAAARVMGASAFSGAVNIVTRPDTHSNIHVNAEGGSYGTFGGGAGLTINPMKKSETFHHAHQVSGGYIQSDGGTENADFKISRGYYQGLLTSRHFDMTWQAGIVSKDFGANTFYSAKFNNQYESTRRFIGSIGATVKPFATNDNRYLASLQIHPMLYGHMDKDHYQLIKGKVGAKAGENYHKTDVYGGSLNINFDWLIGKTALGFDIHNEHIISTALGEPMETSKWKSIRHSDRQYTLEGDRVNTNIFLEHNIIVGGFTLSAGLMLNQNTALDHRFRPFSGIDLSYRPNDNWKFYASWNNALRVPTYTDLYIINPLQKGDVNLKAERNSMFKVGTRYRTYGFSATISGFYSKGTNMIDWVFETETSKQYHAMNIGKLDNMGFNIDTKTNISELICHRELSTPVLLQVGYAYIYQQHETNQQIYRSLYALEYLKHKFVAELSHPIFSHLSASWALRWQQRMNGFHPYAKFDGKLAWNEKTWNIYVKADNITNHRYHDIGAVLQPGLWIMAGGSISFNL